MRELARYARAECALLGESLPLVERARCTRAGKELPWGTSCPCGKHTLGGKLSPGGAWGCARVENLSLGEQTRCTRAEGLQGMPVWKALQWGNNQYRAGNLPLEEWRGTPPGGMSKVGPRGKCKWQFIWFIDIRNICRCRCRVLVR